jgi:hypothetical protein
MERRALSFEHQLRGAEEVRIRREQELEREFERELELVRREHQKVISGRRYRLAQALARPLDFVRRHRNRD